MTGGLDMSLAPSERPGRLGVGVVGAGRVGAVLGASLRNAGHTVTGVHAVSEASRTRAEALLPDVPVLEIPEILRRSEMVLFAVPDDVLGELVAGLAAAGHVQTGHLLVHTSGRYGVGVMAPVRAAGAIPLAIHPAMTFTGLSLDLARLRDCVFGVTADPVVLPVAQALAQAEGVDDRGHALAVDAAAGELGGQEDVLLGGEGRHEVEGLEDEPDVLAADPGELSFAEPREVAAAEEDHPAVGRVEAGEDVHERRLA